MKTIQELKDSFPLPQIEDSENKIKPILEKLFTFKFYDEAIEYLYGELNKIYGWEYPEWRKQLNFWIDKFYRYFPVIRSNEEAANLATEKMYEELFGSVVQDNGARDEAFRACILGTFIKSSSMENITPEMKEKVKEGLYNYYYYDLGEMLSVDYHPDINLRNILEKAGIRDHDIDNIAPWKTAVILNKADNSVSVRKYREIKNY